MEDESMYSRYLHLCLSKCLPPFEEGRKYSVRIGAPPAGGWPNPSVTVRPSTLLDLPPAPKSPSLYIHFNQWCTFEHAITNRVRTPFSGAVVFGIGRHGVKRNVGWYIVC